MADETKVTEKVYCYDHPSAYHNDNALIGAIMSRGKDESCAMWNNPFAYLIWMMMLRNWGGNENGVDYNSRQIAALQDSVNTNHNNELAMQAINGNTSAIRELASNFNCSFSQMQAAVCGVKSAVEQVGGAVNFSAERVINAANLGDLNIVQQLKDCCCATQKEIIKGNYENQLASERQTSVIGSKIDASAAANQLQTCQQTNALGNSIEGVRQSVVSGFSQLGYQSARDTSSIIEAITDSQRKTSDLLNAHWQSETERNLQDAKFEISQLKQNAYLASLIKAATPTTPTA